ncbi:UDP-glucose 4-epimerase GalE [Parasphaerochaeta coccoides]|uniref:UDP-glucose 4-epimerase n=1 Tax=Parasphaerochaeta coccoides (strain ATCC BAA-1237 / DSM 17374 / SPN1) TaxID=760011 RepID=F4GIP7_PARC1|nr:UDP-glucose 4-epimerase GalE [Parasphaerochaeta coccoides]AEC02181.1 UDP-galactose 4-epimerase [Parasphaerochaeta coccoides DSM 17374]
MRVLLVGGAGYIGTHVALAFQDRGDTVGILDNLSTGLKSNVLDGSEFYEGDIMDTQCLDRVFAKGWDAVVHLAAFKAAGESMLKPEIYATNNITGSLNLINACLKHNVMRFILSSSAAVYGEPVYLPLDEAHPKHPTNYYGYTKLAIEQNLEWFDRLKGLKFVALRYFNAAGYDVSGKMLGLEKKPANLIPLVMETAIGKRPNLLVFGNDYPTSDGTGVRDYVHVTDLADAHVSATDYLVAKNTSLTVNLGSGSGVSVQEIIDKSREITGRDIPAQYVDRRPGDPAKLVASSSLAEKELGWKARYSDIETILRTTWEVYLADRKKSVITS